MAARIPAVSVANAASWRVMTSFASMSSPRCGGRFFGRAARFCSSRWTWASRSSNLLHLCAASALASANSASWRLPPSVAQSIPATRTSPRTVGCSRERRGPVLPPPLAPSASLGGTCPGLPIPRSFRSLIDEAIDVGRQQDPSFDQCVGHALDRQPCSVVVNELDRMAEKDVDRDVSILGDHTGALEVAPPPEVREASDVDALGYSPALQRACATGPTKGV